MKKIALLWVVLLMVFAVPASAQDETPVFSPDGEPTFGMFRLTSGFLPDPWIFPVYAGGPVDASVENLGEGCRGFVGAVPDVTMDWLEDSEFSLRIFFVSEGDTTIAVRDPEGNFYCNDDNGLTGDNVTSLDPAITLNTPVAGTYSIWVGTYTADSFIPGYLMFTEIENTYPGNIISSLLSTMTFTTPEE